MNILVKCGSYLESVSCDEILYIQACQNYSKVYLAGSKMILCSMTISSLKDMLPDTFLLCHKSYIVNLSYVKKYCKSGILSLVNNYRVPIARRRKKEFVEMWIKYLNSEYNHYMPLNELR